MKCQNFEWSLNSTVLWKMKPELQTHPQRLPGRTEFGRPWSFCARHPQGRLGALGLRYLLSLELLPSFHPALKCQVGFRGMEPGEGLPRVEQIRNYVCFFQYAPKKTIERKWIRDRSQFRLQSYSRVFVYYITGHKRAKYRSAEFPPLLVPCRGAGAGQGSAGGGVCNCLHPGRRCQGVPSGRGSLKHRCVLQVNFSRTPTWSAQSFTALLAA